MESGDSVPSDSVLVEVKTSGQPYPPVSCHQASPRYHCPQDTQLPFHQGHHSHLLCVRVVSFSSIEERKLYSHLQIDQEIKAYRGMRQWWNMLKGIAIGGKCLPLLLFSPQKKCPEILGGDNYDLQLTQNEISRWNETPDSHFLNAFLLQCTPLLSYPSNLEKDSHNGIQMQ